MDEYANSRGPSPPLPAYTCASMRVVGQAEDLQLDGLRSIVSVGTYDGVHLGHRRIMENLRERAEAEDARSVVVTFDRHPLSLLRPEIAPLRLSDSVTQRRRFSESGIDLLYVLTFDEVRSMEDADAFIDDVLVRDLHASCVMVGSDFRFGHGRRGDVALLTSAGIEKGFTTVGIPLTTVGEFLPESEDRDLPVSSSLIRRYLSTSRLDLANQLLGAAHCVSGIVVGGDRRGGGQLGYPTANLDVPLTMAIPSDGIYAGYLIDRNEGIRHSAAISVGTRPTFYEDGVRLIESFVLDFDGDLYGHEIEVVFHTLLREQRRFASVTELVDQIAIDVEQTRALQG